MADEIELDANPESTWGASDEYKAAWSEKYGDNPPPRNASKAEWEDYATKHGVSEAEAEDATREELAARVASTRGASAPTTGAASSAE